ncbi:MAG: alpha-L-rhamnosidase [Armatimonadetes bacterium]|nr:alpha-L-rhamnosidase [Armatimonadota bacterium]
MEELFDLSPARWIWFPSQRTLPCTVVLFRKLVTLAKLGSCAGWIFADSRYRIWVNGKIVQWGPAPSDPREPEVDPLDLGPHLKVGDNLIVVEVLYYGQGDGTHPIGKPGFIMNCSGEAADVITDDSWACRIDRGFSPGRAPRWFLRAFQEIYDSRKSPAAWKLSLDAGPGWVFAQVLNLAASRPPISSGYSHYSADIWMTHPENTALRPRSIPLMALEQVDGERMTTSSIEWKLDPEDWFDFRAKDGFSARRTGAGGLPVHLEAQEPSRATGITIEFDRQIVGWPEIEIDAPEGTIIELIPCEGHDPSKAVLLDTQFYAWSRLICRGGPQVYRTFEYESLRWLQLVVRNNHGPVDIKRVSIIRRQQQWPHQPEIVVDDPELQRLMDAAVNTLHNSAQETCVDGMARERQQYAGDGSHQVRAIRPLFGATQMSARFIDTFSKGQLENGIFMDCWPAWDRMARLSQLPLGLTSWGPLLDHGIGFVFDCWDHYMATGQLDDVRKVHPRLVKFAKALLAMSEADGLLPVENLEGCSVWIDHEAYRTQGEKRLAFNLYAAAMLTRALAPLSEELGVSGAGFRQEGQRLLKACVENYWHESLQTWVNNLPEIRSLDQARCCDRSLATAILFDQCPGGRVGESVRLLAEMPGHVGRSYPANAVWRHWALAKAGRMDRVVRELRERWVPMRSVRENLTIGEFWEVVPDSTSQWSHCAIAPVLDVFDGLMGLFARRPGFAEYTIRPHLADFPGFRTTAYLPIGALHWQSTVNQGFHEVRLLIPPAGSGVVELPANSRSDLTGGQELLPDGRMRMKLPAGKQASFWIPVGSN